MVEETARHAGHMDIVRELIDGATGDHPAPRRTRNHNFPEVVAWGGSGLGEGEAERHCRADNHVPWGKARAGPRPGHGEAERDPVLVLDVVDVQHGAEPGARRPGVQLGLVPGVLDRLPAGLGQQVARLRTSNCTDSISCAPAATRSTSSRSTPSRSGASTVNAAWHSYPRNVR